MRGAPTVGGSSGLLRLVKPSNIRRMSTAGTKKYPQDSYTPRPEDHFTFGLWTVGNRGRDPFGDAVRATIPPVKTVENQARLGAYGVNLHDNDLVPSDASPSDRDRIVKGFQAALRETGMKVPMATTNLFYDPVFKEGAFTNNDARVRAYALQKTMRAMDLGVELGATTYVFWAAARVWRPTPPRTRRTR